MSREVVRSEKTSWRNNLSAGDKKYGAWGPEAIVVVTAERVKQGVGKEMVDACRWWSGTMLRSLDFI